MTRSQMNPNDPRDLDDDELDKVVKDEPSKEQSAQAQPHKDEHGMVPLEGLRPLEPVAPLADATKRAPFAVKRPRIARDASTEDLLNGLIAECHFAIREVAIPSACETNEALTRRCFLSEIRDLTRAGAQVGGTVALLRAADSKMVQGKVLEQIGDEIQPIPVLES